VRYWEIGNEIDHQGVQRYWLSDDDEKALEQYAFGGTQRQRRQRVGTPRDHRPSASVSNGEPGQQFTVWFPPVVPKSQVVRVKDVTWHEVDDLSSAGAEDRVYTFRPSTGTIVFGNGRHGAIPPRGAKITVTTTPGHMPASWTTTRR
jgi:alpha-L-arabinofuranosidase